MHLPWQHLRPSSAMWNLLESMQIGMPSGVEWKGTTVGGSAAKLYSWAPNAGDQTQCEASLSEGGERTRAINKYDYGLLEALKHARRSFVITDPTLPDNPIVFASGGFLSLTGYKLEQVLGRNCRFLQGPRTDARAVGKIREAIKHGTDVQICLLNYKIDSTTFWNHFFIAALRDDNGDVVNFLGVQIEISEIGRAHV